MYPVQYKFEVSLLCNPRVKTHYFTNETCGIWHQNMVSTFNHIHMFMSIQSPKLHFSHIIINHHGSVNFQNCIIDDLAEFNKWFKANQFMFKQTDEDKPNLSNNAIHYTCQYMSSVISWWLNLILDLQISYLDLPTVLSC
jgi:hypothetical protein